MFTFNPTATGKNLFISTVYKCMTKKIRQSVAQLTLQNNQIILTIFNSLTEDEEQHLLADFKFSHPEYSFEFVEVRSVVQ